MIVAPFGTWRSEVSPELMARGGVRLTMPEVLPDGSFTWCESRPRERGRIVPVRMRRGGAPTDLVPAPHGARSLVHEYGGRAYVCAGDAVYFVAAADQRLHRARSGEVVPIGDGGGFRLAEPTLDATRGRVLAVGERARPGEEAENGIVTVDLETGAVRWLVRGHDFFASPALSPDGRRLAYLAWDHPAMPWDAATLLAVDVAEGGEVGPEEALAGGPDGSAFQPTWSPTGDLHASIEVGERWCLHHIRGGAAPAGTETRRAELIADAGVELGAPLWNLGTRLYGFSDATTVIGTGLTGGRSRVVRIDVRTGETSPVACDLSHVGELAVRGADLLLIAGWAGSGSRLVHVDLATGSETVLRDALAGLLAAEDRSTPEAISFPTSGGDTAHANFYGPRSARFRGPAGSLPPVIVTAHGGPTGCANTEASLGVHFWTTRGFAVVDVNYRGSTGYGRAYRERLRGAWGEVDVDDCVAAVRYLTAEGRVDPGRAIIRGASAGGYTVLQALTDHDVFHAAACHYGPSDPRALLHESHKFESRYDHFLFGTGKDRDDTLDARAPIRKIASVRAPVIFFQGLEDKAVPPAQTERMYRTLKERGVVTEYHAYAGEQHGFRSADTIVDVWTKELAFYRRVLEL